MLTTLMVSNTSGDGDHAGGRSVTSISGRGCCMASFTLGKDCASVFSSWFCREWGFSRDNIICQSNHDHTQTRTNISV